MLGIRNMLDILETQLQLKIVESGTDTYLFSSAIGVNESEAKWSIRKVDTNGNTTYPIDPKTGIATNAFKFIPADYEDLVYQYGTYTILPTISFTINNGDATTSDTEVTLQPTITSYLDVVGYYVSETNSLPNSLMETSEITSFILSEGLGVKTLYYWVKDIKGNISNAGTDTIELV